MREVVTDPVQNGNTRGNPMAFRQLSIVLVVLMVVLLSVGSLMAQTPTTYPSTCARQEVVGQTVVCDPAVEQPNCLATWWANSALGNFCRNVARDTKRNNCWPQPFIKADREAVRMPFVLMVANGWKRQNTLGDQHFEAETGKLTSDGKLKIRRILLQGLPQHRALWVYRSARLTETAARVNAVNAFARQTVRDGSTPRIYETDIPPAGWPAQRIYTIGEKWYASMPDPILPKEQYGGEASE
jgi:hypothetical protein